MVQKTLIAVSVQLKNLVQSLFESGTIQHLRFVQAKHML